MDTAGNGNEENGNVEGDVVAAANGANGSSHARRSPPRLRSSRCRCFSVITPNSRSKSKYVKQLKLNQPLNSLRELA